jgi:FOG: CheY-like receiver
MAQTSAQPRDPLGQPRKRILVVEDNELNMRLFRDVLVAYGYMPLEIRDGARAIDAVRTERPDLVVLDIQLPGMNGMEIGRRLKEDAATRAIPIVAVTAFALKADERRVRETGCEAYLSKPISLKTFIETVRRLTGK